MITKKSYQAHSRSVYVKYSEKGQNIINYDKMVLTETTHGGDQYISRQRESKQKFRVYELFDAINFAECKLCYIVYLLDL